MRKIILIISLVSVIVLVSTCAKRKEGYCRLKYQAVDTSESTISYACQDQMKLEEKPNQLKDLPKKVSGQVSYFLAKIGDRDIPLLMDHMNESTLYVDTDADGFLSDERGYSSKAVKRRIFGRVDYYRFGPISMEFEQADGKYAKRIYVISRDEKMRYITLCPADYRKGKVLLGDAIYEVRVLDGNFDGKYGEIFSPPVERIWRPGCDSLAIDLNRNGKLDYHYYHHSELMPLSRMVKVGDSYYSINVAESGESLELNKIQPDFGTLDLGNEKVKLKLWSDAAQQFISNIKYNVKIPAGMYQALFIEWNHIDSTKNTWDFTCYRDTGSLKNFEIPKDQTTSFKIGPPFQIRTTTRHVNNSVGINFTLQGQAQEVYGANFKRNGVQVSPPVVRIIDEQGGEVDSGRFKYG